MKGFELKNAGQRAGMLLLVLLSAGVYWNTLPNDFVAGDRQFILRNEHIGEVRSVLNSFTADYWGELGGESFMYYRPLVIVSHFIDIKLYGLNPAGHHFSNVILHCMVTLAGYVLFLTLLSGNHRLALAGALLFALHPIHTHSVSYIVGRTDILATFFFLLSLILLVRINQDVNHSKLSLLAACLCFFVSLLCKEIAVTLPLVFVFYRFCCESKKFSLKDKRLLIPLLYLAGTLCCFLAIRCVAVGFSSPYPDLPPWYSFSQKIWLVFKTLGFYLLRLLFPLHLCYYSNLVVPASLSELTASPAFWTGMVFLLTLALSVRHFPPLCFALGWIGLTLLPVLNIIILPELTKENYLYLPSIGFCLIFPLVIAECKKSIAERKVLYPLFAYSGIILIGICYAGGTVIRNYDYKDPVTFLKSTLEQMPQVAQQHREDPRYFEPVKNYYTTYRNLGILYQQRNQLEKAVTSFNRALDYTPSYFSPRYAASVKTRLGTLFYKQGRLEEALTILEKVRPDSENQAMLDNLLRAISTQLQENNAVQHGQAG